jgi:hypothetical protein
MYNNHGDPGLFDPRDAVAHTWHDCQYTAIGIPGYGWLSATSPGRICIVRSEQDLRMYPLIGDCTLPHSLVDVVYCSNCAGVCGEMGDEPCGPSAVEGKTWGKIKSIFR